MDTSESKFAVVLVYDGVPGQVQQFDGTYEECIEYIKKNRKKYKGKTELAILDTDTKRLVSFTIKESGLKSFRQFID